MREIIIGKNEAGKRFDKVLKSYLSNASASFIYKMLRKKNIVLDDKKADGREKLSKGQSVKMYFSEETFKKMTGEDSLEKGLNNLENTDALEKMVDMLKSLIIYEDENLLIFSKPSGWLSQKAGKDDISVNEICISYLYKKGEITDESMRTFKPSICNRLDRNTSGIMVFGKTLIALQEMAKLFKTRDLNKYYIAVVKGELSVGGEYKAYLSKDNNGNQVNLINEYKKGYKEIRTSINPIFSSEEYSVIELELITGKTHQLRAHLAYLGHPIIGDPKYGDMKINKKYRNKFKINSQLLHAYRLEFPSEINYDMNYLSGKVFKAKYGKEFEKFMEK